MLLPPPLLSSLPLFLFPSSTTTFTVIGRQTNQSSLTCLPLFTLAITVCFVPSQYSNKHHLLKDLDRGYLLIRATKTPARIPSDRPICTYICRLPSPASLFACPSSSILPNGKLHYSPHRLTRMPACGDVSRLHRLPTNTDSTVCLNHAFIIFHPTDLAFNRTQNTRHHGLICTSHS